MVTCRNVFLHGDETKLRNYLVLASWTKWVNTDRVVHYGDT